MSRRTTALGQLRRDARAPTASSGTIQSILGSLLIADFDGTVPSVGAVATWTNSVTGNGDVAQGTSSLRPTANGTTVTPDGVDDRLGGALTAGSVSGSRPYVFVVAKFATLPSSAQYHLSFREHYTDDGTHQGATLACAAVTSGQWEFDRNSSDGLSQTKGAGYDTDIHILEFGHTASGVDGFVYDGLGMPTAKTGATSVDMTGVLMFSASFASAVLPSKLGVYRMLVCSDMPSAGQKSAVRALLKKQYAVPNYPSFNAEFFDLSSISAGAGALQAFVGGLAVGDYVYLAPATNHNLATRYNTTLPFTDSGSWETFNLTSIGADGWHQDMCYDGSRYIYICPYGQYLTRYDTQGSFTSSGSWAKFDLKTVATDGWKFAGIIHHGNYIYLLPDANDLNPDSGKTIFRYDTTASFTAAGSYTTFDLTTVDANARGFAFGIMVGDWLYMCPWDSGTASTSHLSGLVVRYDTTASFTAAGSYETFDAAVGVHADCKGYGGIAYDGTYLYFAPVEITRGGADGYRILRYDTGGTFTAAGSWTSWPTTDKWKLAKGFWNPCFDGRYVWFPGYGQSGGGMRMTVRYDTLGSFTDPASYDGIDFAQHVGSTNLTKGHAGSAICNGYVYIVPNEQDEIFRVPI